MFHLVYETMADMIPFPVGDFDPPPNYCDYSTDEQYHDATDRYRRDICDYLVRDRDDLDAWLTTGDRTHRPGRARPYHLLSRDEQRTIDAANAEAARTVWSGWATPQGGDG